MKRVLSLAFLFLAIPTGAFADTIVDFTNSHGSLSGGFNGLFLESALTGVEGVPGITSVSGVNLGVVSFFTGQQISGSLQVGGTFSPSGSFFTIVGDGAHGIPNGVIFTGAFSTPVTWTLENLANGTHQYELTGGITGTLYDGLTLDGATVQDTVNIGSDYFIYSAAVSTGVTGTVLEPSSIFLLAVGLVSLASMTRRRSSAQQH